MKFAILGIGFNQSGSILLLTGHFTTVFKSLSKQLGFCSISYHHKHFRLIHVPSKTNRNHLVQLWLLQQNFQLSAKKLKLINKWELHCCFQFSSEYCVNSPIARWRISTMRLTPSSTQSHVKKFNTFCSNRSHTTDISAELYRTEIVVLILKESSSNENGLETCKAHWLVLSTTSFCIFLIDKVLLCVTWSIRVLRK